MTGKIICLFLGLFLAQGLVSTSNIIPSQTVEDILASLNNFLIDLKSVLEKINAISVNEGADFLERGNSILDFVGEDFINYLFLNYPACAEEQAPIVNEALTKSKDYLKTCVADGLPQAKTSADELNTNVNEIQTLTDDIQAKSDACYKLTSIVEVGVCLGKLINEVDPAILKAIEEATPVVQEAYLQYTKLNNCLESPMSDMQKLKNEILLEIGECKISKVKKH